KMSAAARAEELIKAGQGDRKNEAPSLRVLAQAPGRRTKSQCAKAPSPATEPRKLCSPVLSRLKHGSKGRLLRRAQTASPFTLSVPAGSPNVFADPEPLG